MPDMEILPFAPASDIGLDVVSFFWVPSPDVLVAAAVSPDAAVETVPVVPPSAGVEVTPWLFVSLVSSTVPNEQPDATVTIADANKIACNLVSFILLCSSYDYPSSNVHA
jgi:hypothetical protein